MSARKPGLRHAVNAKCRACSYDPLDVGTWRRQAERCTCTDCPLYPVRPKPVTRKLSRIGVKTGRTGEDHAEVRP